MMSRKQECAEDSRWNHDHQLRRSIDKFRDDACFHRHAREDWRKKPNHPFAKSQSVGDEWHECREATRGRQHKRALVWHR